MIQNAYERGPWLSAFRLTRPLLFLLLVLICCVLKGPAAAQTQATGDTPFQLPLASKAAVVIDAASGRVLYAYNAHQPLPPASVTKVMTLLLALEAVDAGQLSLDDMVTTSARAASMGGTQIWLEPGEQMSLREMLWAIAVGSANDAAVAVAEHLAGSEPAFAQLMNERARELGAQNTHFLNASGLPPADVGYTGEHVTSAYDLAIISRHALKFPLFREMVATWGPVVMRPEGSRVPELYTYNRMLRTYPGMDGIKTGYTSEAGYSISASATRGGIQVIAVTLGAPTSQGRDDDVRRLLDYGFSRLRAVPVLNAGETVDYLTVPRGEPARVAVTVKEDLVATLLRDEPEEPETEIHWHTDQLQLPLPADHPVGTVVVKAGNTVVAEAVLVTVEPVQKASWTQIILRHARRLLARDF